MASPAATFKDFEQSVSDAWDIQDLKLEEATETKRTEKTEAVEVVEPMACPVVEHSKDLSLRTPTRKENVGQKTAQGFQILRARTFQEATFLDYPALPKGKAATIELKMNANEKMPLNV